MNIKDVRRNNVLALIDARFKGNRAAFARDIGRPAPNIHRMLADEESGIEKRGIGEKLARDIEEKLGLAPYFLDSINIFQKQPGDSLTVIGTGNTSPAPDIKDRQIPLISWVQAGNFCASPDLLAPGDAERWLPSHKTHGPHTYALRVKGSSMVSPYPGQRSYPEGTIIYVDPDKPITNGCRVVARIHDSEEATFKEYVEDAGKRYLRPLNPQFPTIELTEGMHICGVVVLSTMEE